MLHNRGGLIHCQRGGLTVDRTVIAQHDHVVFAGLGQGHIEKLQGWVGCSREVDPVAAPLVAVGARPTRLDVEGDGRPSSNGLAGGLSDDPWRCPNNGRASRRRRTGRPVGRIIAIRSRAEAVQGLSDAIRCQRPEGWIVLILDAVNQDVRHAQ